MSIIAEMQPGSTEMPPTLCHWPTSGGLHESKPDWSPDRLIWDSLRQACRKPNGIWALDNHAVTMAVFSIGTEVSAFVG